MIKQKFTLGDEIGYIKLLDYLGSDERVVLAARVSFDKGLKDPEKDESLINYLLKHGHLTPLEHCTFTFEVKAPLVVARQWMRHRTMKYNELSRRFTSTNREYYIPKKLRIQDSVNKQSSIEVESYDNENDLLSIFSDVVDFCEDKYKILLEAGVARELARFVLPTMLYTKFIVTVDLRNLLHFLKLRLAEDTQYELRVYAEAILDMISDIVPITIKYWKKYHLQDEKV